MGFANFLYLAASMRLLDVSPREAADNEAKHGEWLALLRQNALSDERTRLFLTSQNVPLAPEPPRPKAPERRKEEARKTRRCKDCPSLVAEYCESARLLNNLLVEPKAELGCRIVTACDEGYFLPFQILYASLRLSHAAPVTLFDLGLTAEQRKWCDRHGIERIEQDLDSLPMPTNVKMWQTWNKPHYLRQLDGRLLWIDADCIVTGSLKWLDELLNHRPVPTACFAAIHYHGYRRGLACLRNHDRLYERYPTPVRLNVFPNAGVLALDRCRDAELLDRWLWMVGEAAAHPELRDWLKWFDQGCLQWALEKCGLDEIVVADRRFNDPVSAVGAKSLDELNQKLEGLEDARVCHFPADNKPYQFLPRGLPLELNGYPENRNDLTLFILGHERDKLAAISDAPQIRKVYLPELSPDNDLAECRVFQSDLLLNCDSEYIGLCSQSWNEKYGSRRPKALPVESLHRLPMRPDVVWAADLTGQLETRPGVQDWRSYSESIHPGINAILEDAIRECGIQCYRCFTLWSNNFIAHRSVVQALVEFWRFVYDFLFQRYGSKPPYGTEGWDESRHWSYLGERISMLFWESRPQLVYKQIPR